VIPNGFDPARLSPAKERQKRVLVVSRLFKRKGIDRVIKAFSSLATDYELHIVGDGPQLSELRSLAQGASRRIHFRGWLDNSDPQLRELYETSGIFALPSEAENFPVSLLEAMAGGLAIVTSKGTGCADVVGDSALLVPATDTQELGEALKRLIDDEQLRSHLGYSARQRLESHFAWPLVAQRYVDVFSGTEKVAIHG
jgi:glycosyltransferase involved in cell wall biosynthesis